MYQLLSVGDQGHGVVHAQYVGDGEQCLIDFRRGDAIFQTKAQVRFELLDRQGNGQRRKFEKQPGVLIQRAYILEHAFNHWMRVGGGMIGFHDCVCYGSFNFYADVMRLIGLVDDGVFCVDENGVCRGVYRQ